MGFIDGVKRVGYIVGMVAAVVFVLFLIGMINQKARGMTAVFDGLADIFTWIGQLISILLARL